jgi:hypothetical protein
MATTTRAPSRRRVTEVTPPRVQQEYNSPLDPGIAPAVIALADGGVETFESCQGGPGHAYPEPTVRFHGDTAEGYRALAVALRAGLPVLGLRRVWPIVDGGTHIPDHGQRALRRVY